MFSRGPLGQASAWSASLDHAMVWLQSAWPQLIAPLTSLHGYRIPIVRGADKCFTTGKSVRSVAVLRTFKLVCRPGIEPVMLAPSTETMQLAMLCCGTHFKALSPHLTVIRQTVTGRGVSSHLRILSCFGSSLPVYTYGSRYMPRR